VEAAEEKKKEVDLKAVKKDILAIIENLDYDDGSYGPLFIRLAWHASGTYDKTKKTGGSNGAGMRFAPESDWGANAGLGIARGLLEKVKQKHPEISYSDLWIYAGYVALESMGGPTIPMRLGRVDYPDGKKYPLPDGLLPDATHARNICVTFSVAKDLMIKKLWLYLVLMVLDAAMLIEVDSLVHGPMLLPLSLMNFSVYFWKRNG
jgi:hypothetical protein